MSDAKLTSSLEKAFRWQSIFNKFQQTFKIIQVFNCVDPMLHHTFEKLFADFLSGLPEPVQNSLEMYTRVANNQKPNELSEFEYNIITQEVNLELNSVIAAPKSFYLFSDELKKGIVNNYDNKESTKVCLERYPKWLTKAAKGGFAPAQSQLGYCNEHGFMVLKKIITRHFIGAKKQQNKTIFWHSAILEFIFRVESERQKRKNLPLNGTPKQQFKE